MKNANIGNIAAEQPITKHSHFNLNHDNNTTYSWGEVQPLLGKMMLPDSTMNIKNEQLIRVAPLVVPTFGRVKMVNVAHFIPIQEIYPNFDAMMAQTKVSRTSIYNSAPSTSTYVPKEVPNIENNILASWILAGAKVNLYFSDAVGTPKEDVWYCARNTGSYGTPAGWPNATTAAREYIYKLLDIPDVFSPSLSTIWQIQYQGYTFNTSKLFMDRTTTKARYTNDANPIFTLPTISTMVSTPLANANGNGYTHSANNEQNAYDLSIGDEHITFEGADLIWESPTITASMRNNTDSVFYGITSNTFDGCKIRLVFKLSSFGKRLRKILIGLNYDTNLENMDKVSILPLIGFYKTWWDKYAPEREKNFYETPAWKIIQASMAGANATDLTAQMQTSGASDLRNYFIEFMSDMGTMFATEKLDAISAATDRYQAASNTETGTNLSAQTDMQREILAQINAVLNEPDYAAANADGSQSSEFTQGMSNPFTNPITNSISNWLNKNFTDIRLTQPQINGLKNAYIMMNKASVAGMCVEEILRALGFGDYVEECKGKFINQSETIIKISDVISTAATDKAKLGQYGGRGMGIGQYSLSYSTNRYGYLFIMSCIIPEGGYINAPARENEAINFEKMYNPQFDGIAFEAIEKKNLMGSPLIADETYKDTFGFLPTYSQWKFMSNKANGDFSLNSRKTYMTPYTLDKMIPIADPNVYSVEETNGHAGSTTEACSPTFKYSDCPNAGEDYRFINKFPWNGNYNRIFEQEGDGIEWSVFSPNNNSFLYNAFEYDNFMCHNVFDIDYMAKMKPIEDSYNTYDEEHDAPKTSIKRS